MRWDVGRSLTEAVLLAAWGMSRVVHRQAVHVQIVCHLAGVVSDVVGVSVCVGKRERTLVGWWHVVERIGICLLPRVAVKTAKRQTKEADKRFDVFRTGSVVVVWGVVKE